jgi:hypothetical protein
VFGGGERLCLELQKALELWQLGTWRAEQLRNAIVAYIATLGKQRLYFRLHFILPFHGKMGRDKQVIAIG